MGKKWKDIQKDYEAHCLRISQSTSIDRNETRGEKRERIIRLEKSYTEWFTYYFPHYALAPCGWFHLKAAEMVINNSVLYLILEWFRGAAKSVHICMGLPLYLMLVKKEMNFMLLIGENADKAKILLSDIQAELQFNELLKNDYGKHYKHGDWAEGDFSTKGGIKFKALGVGQSPRGVRKGASRPDYIVCDDLDTKKRCKNPSLITEAVEWVMEDLWGCFYVGSNKPRRFVMANNRIHKNSILANMVNSFKESNTKAVTKKIPLRHFHIKVNILDEHGNPSWKENHTLKDVDEIVTSRPYRSSQREYFNNPIQDGKIFKAKDIQYKSMLPLEKYDALVIYGDLSYKAAGDFKALKFWGKIHRELHHITCYDRQGSRRNCAIWLYDLYEDWNLKDFNIDYYIEGLFAMDEFVDDFDEEGDERGYYIPIVADREPKGDKFDRIDGISGFWERKNVYYNIDEKDQSDDLFIALDQTLSFEKGSGAHDDGPDADHGAIRKLQKATFTSSFQPRIGKRKITREF